MSNSFLGEDPLLLLVCDTLSRTDPYAHAAFITHRRKVGRKHLDNGGVKVRALPLPSFPLMRPRIMLSFLAAG